MHTRSSCRSTALMRCLAYMGICLACIGDVTAVRSHNVAPFIGTDDHGNVHINTTIASDINNGTRVFVNGVDLVETQAALLQYVQSLESRIQVLEDEMKKEKSAVDASNSSSPTPFIVAKSGTYSEPFSLEIPDGFTRPECTYFWGSRETYYGGTGDLVPLFGADDEPTFAYSGRYSWINGAWLMICVKNQTRSSND